MILPNKKLKKVYIEIGNICNLSCRFCPKTKRKPKIMTVDEWRHILSEVAPYTIYINLHVMGEPLLHPNLKEFLYIAHEFDLKVNITTNGTLIKKLAPVLKSSPALNKISISLHSFESNVINISDLESYTMEDYIKNISEFANDISQNTDKKIVALRLWNIDSQTLKGENKLNDDIIANLQKYINTPLQISDTLDDMVNRGNSRDLKLLDRVFLQMAEKFKWPSMDEDICNEKAFCYGMRDHFAILVDGTVVPCCLDHEGDIPLGNVHETPLQSIIEGERAMGVYNGFSNRVPVEGLCKRCGYVDRFKHKL